MASKFVQLQKNGKFSFGRRLVSSKMGRVRVSARVLVLYGYVNLKCGFQFFFNISLWCGYGFTVMSMTRYLDIAQSLGCVLFSVWYHYYYSHYFHGQMGLALERAISALLCQTQILCAWRPVSGCYTTQHNTTQHTQTTQIHTHTHTHTHTHSHPHTHTHTHTHKCTHTHTYYGLVLRWPICKVTPCH